MVLKKKKGNIASTFSSAPAIRPVFSRTASSSSSPSPSLDTRRRDAATRRPPPRDGGPLCRRRRAPIGPPVGRRRCRVPVDTKGPETRLVPSRSVALTSEGQGEGGYNPDVPNARRRCRRRRRRDVASHGNRFVRHRTCSENPLGPRRHWTTFGHPLPRRAGSASRWARLALGVQVQGQVHRLGGARVLLALPSPWRGRGQRGRGSVAKGIGRVRLKGREGGRRRRKAQHRVV